MHREDENTLRELAIVLGDAIERQDQRRNEARAAKKRAWKRRPRFILDKRQPRQGGGT